MPLLRHYTSTACGRRAPWSSTSIGKDTVPCRRPGASALLRQRAGGKPLSYQPRLPPADAARRPVRGDCHRIDSPFMICQGEQNLTHSSPTPEAFDLWQPCSGCTRKGCFRFIVSLLIHRTGWSDPPDPARTGQHRGYSWFSASTMCDTTPGLGAATGGYRRRHLRTAAVVGRACVRRDLTMRTAETKPIRRATSGEKPSADRLDHTPFMRHGQALHFP